MIKDGEEEDVFAAVQRGDVLLHHPFDSFQPVVGLLQKAARDPNVLAIKVTLYRVGRNAPIVDALVEAAENGKQVAVLLELKARFDEESNIGWARKLEEYGVHVVYGLVGLKVHAKALLVVRKEGDVIRRYAHLSTGNYNSVTAQLYTDIGMMTCDPQIGADCTDLFNFLTGYQPSSYRKLLVSPVTLRKGIEQLIQREIEHQKSGRGGHLIFKMNALVDRKMIELLYQASQAGVKVQLLVRGICCLIPGIPGISDNITVTSIVGRFLEQQPHLLLPQWRRRAGVPGECRPDAAQPQSPGRGRLPGARSKAGSLCARRNSGNVLEGTGQGTAYDGGRQVRARS